MRKRKKERCGEGNKERGKEENKLESEEEIQNIRKKRERKRQMYASNTDKGKKLILILL